MDIPRPKFIAAHPLISAISFFMLVSLPQWFEAVWGLFSDRPFFQWLSTESGIEWSMPSFLGWVVTILGLFGMLYVIWLLQWNGRRQKAIYIKVGGGTHSSGEQKFDDGDIVPNPTEKELKASKGILKTPKELGQEWTNQRRELDRLKPELERCEQQWRQEPAELKQKDKKIDQLMVELESAGAKLTTATAKLRL